MRLPPLFIPLFLAADVVDKDFVHCCAIAFEQVCQEIIRSFTSQSQLVDQEPGVLAIKLRDVTCDGHDVAVKVAQLGADG